MLFIEENNFSKIKSEADSFYKNIGDIYCPYLKTKVSFNAKGLAHIKMKSWNKTRSKNDQYIRLRFIKFAPIIIKLSNILQEIQKQENEEKVKISGTWIKKYQSITYFTFVAIINKLRLKIIIKKIGHNKPYFWSIIPFWKKRICPISRKTKKVFHEGDLKYE